MVPGDSGHRDVLEFGDITAGQDLPVLAWSDNANQAIAGGKVKRAGVAGSKSRAVTKG